MGVVDTFGLGLSQFSLVTGFFEGMRENILHIFRASETGNELENEFEKV